MVSSATLQAADGPTDEKTTAITRIEVAPVIDGVLDDPAWADAVIVGDLHQVKPIEFGDPTERTQFLLLYDGNALYIGVRAFDSEPGGVTARVLRQGEGLRGEDRVKVLLSPFNDKRSGYSFLVNPNGVRFEGIYKDGNFDREWSGIWHAASKIGQDGWTTEIRIPFKTLSFNVDEDWGINFSREIARKQEEVGWMSRDRSMNPATVGTLTGLSGLSQGIGLDVVPSYSISGSRSNDTGDSETTSAPSLDLFYKVTPGLNASLTINTDFSATEVDNRQVNLTRFNLFFPEKRAFFQRESDIFEFGGIGGNNRSSSRADKENGRPYFSRRIGLSSNGQPVDLDVGAKLSGRIGRWNLGLQGIRQAEFEAVDATDIFVARITANVLKESTAGFIVTSGDPRSNLDNSLLGVDYRYRNSRLPQGRRLNASVWYQQSDTQGLDGDDSAFGFSIGMPSNSGWSVGVAAKEIQENFNPAVGFVSRSDIRLYSADMGYTYQRNGPLVRSLWAGIDMQRTEQIGGDLQSQKIRFVAMNLQTDGGDQLKIAYTAEKELLTTPFEISDGVVIPPGDYSFGAFEIEIETGEHRAANIELKYEFGDFYDGTISSINSEISWRPSRHIGLKASFRVDDVRLPQGNFTTRLASAQLDFVISNSLSWINLVQYDNVSNNIGINSRLHWVPQAGRNVYLVLNHNFQERLSDGDFHSTNTDLTLKADYTFRF